MREEGRRAGYVEAVGGAYVLSAAPAGSELTCFLQKHPSKRRRLPPRTMLRARRTPTSPTRHLRLPPPSLRTPFALSPSSPPNSPTSPTTPTTSSALDLSSSDPPKPLQPVDQAPRSTSPGAARREDNFCEMDPELYARLWLQKQLERAGEAWTREEDTRLFERASGLFNFEEGVDWEGLRDEIGSERLPAQCRARFYAGFEAGRSRELCESLSAWRIAEGS